MFSVRDQHALGGGTETPASRSQIVLGPLGQPPLQHSIGHSSEKQHHGQEVQFELVAECSMHAESKCQSEVAKEVMVTDSWLPGFWIDGY